eukprot:362366-Chlamydomonas_euryale.AAC.2
MEAWATVGHAACPTHHQVGRFSGIHCERDDIRSRHVGVNATRSDALQGHAGLQARGSRPSRKPKACTYVWHMETWPAVIPSRSSHADWVKQICTPGRYRSYKASNAHNVDQFQPPKQIIEQAGGHEASGRT